MVPPEIRSKPTWIEPLLFPQNRLIHLAVIVFVSCIFSLILTGKQIYRANWGLIDDYAVFDILGSNQESSFSQLWNYFLAKAGAGEYIAQSRPVAYLLRVIQTWLFGQNVHLWYVRNTICFALFLSSVWWIISRFVGAWLGGALTAYLALLPMWSDIWSRLGPSEIEGVGCSAVIIFAADTLFFSKKPWARNVGAITFSLAAIALAGIKENFVPLAVGSLVFVLLLAVWQGKLSSKLASVLATIGIISIAAISFVIWTRLRATGVDIYGRPVGLGYTLGFTAIGLVDALVRTWWIWILPILLLQLLKLTASRPLLAWSANSPTASWTYVFVIATYAAQCGIYRAVFPTNMRYDFPSMLLVPIVIIILACEIFNKLHELHPKRVINYAQLIAAAFVTFALATTTVRRTPELMAAGQANIKKTNLFFNELQRLVAAANTFTDRPIILEAHGPVSYEAVYSLRIFLSAFGAHNPVSVRFHPTEYTADSYLAGLSQGLVRLESDGEGFVPLAVTLSGLSHGCFSVGLYGPPDSTCIGFRISERTDETSF
jgi:hypothetical protein